jgi:electron transfer flavoprotein alpha/beta subunit
VNIVVCCKIVRNLDDVSKAEWKDARRSDFRIDHTRKIWNFFDESALETALCIKDAWEGQGGSCDLTAITAVNPDDRIDPFLKDLIAVKFSRAIKILCPTDLCFSPLLRARLIAKHIEKYQYDAILTGSQASPADAAQTPALIAELLAIPFIDHVTDLSPGAGALICSSLIENGRRTAAISAPAVYAFSNAKHTYLRVATLREKMNAPTDRILALDSADIADMDKLRPDRRPPDGFRVAQEGKACVMVEGDTPEAKARALFDIRRKEIFSP